MPLSFEEFKKRQREIERQPKSEEQAQESAPWHGFSERNESRGYKAWQDWKGNVNLSNLNTGETNRFYQAYNHIGGADSNRSPAMDSLGADLGQTIGGTLQRQGANYKAAGANLLISMADLFNGKKEFQPKVGSALWRMQQGAAADTGVANKLLEDSKYGHGKAYGLVMDLTSGAIDLASDALLTAATGGASIGGKLGITAGLGAMGARSFGGAAEEARQQGKSTGQQFLSGLKSASIEVLTEKIGGPFERIYGKSALGGLTRNMADRLGKSAGMKFVLNRLGDFSGEAAEEMLSDVLNPLADRILKLDNGEGWEQLWTKEGMSQMAYDGLVGGLLGLFGGAAEGISGKAKTALIGDSIDSAMAASQQGRSIGAELENDNDGIIASAISNQAPQQAPSPVAPQTAPEAQMQSAPTETAPTTQSKVKPQAEELNIEPEAERPKQKRIGEKTGRDIAWSTWFGDETQARETREAEGVGVDASDFTDEDSTTEPESGKVETKKVTPTAAERLANYNNPQTTDTAYRGLKGRAESAVRNALAQNGIDYSNDPRAEYYDENTGEYREEDVDLLDEEARAKYQADMRQIRLLDAVDEWLDKNGQRYLSAKKGSEAEIQQNLQNALNDYVRRYLDSQTDKASNSEAVEDVMQQRRQDSKLKSLAKEEKQEAPTGYNTVQVGENLFRVTGPGGITTTEVADNSADAVQKHIDGLTEENRKKAKERKAKEQELKKLRQEVQESQENPKQIEGSDGKLYEVTKELTKGENNYQYVVTELDEDGLPIDMEARIFRKNATNEEEAVQHAIEHPEYFNDGSVEGEVWEERSGDERHAGSTAEELAGNVSQNNEGNAGREELGGENGNNLREGFDGGERRADVGVSQTVQEDSGILRERSSTPREYAEKWLKILHPDATVIPEGADSVADEAYNIGKELGASAVIVCDHLDDGTVAEVKGGIVLVDLNSLKWFIRHEPGGVSVPMIHERLHQYASTHFGRRNDFGVDFESERKAQIATTAKFSELYNELLAKHGEAAEKAFAAYAFGYNGYEKSAQDVLNLVELAKPFDNAEDRARFLEGYVAEELLVDLAAGAKARIKYNTSISDSEYNALRKSVLESISKEFFNGRDTSDIKALLKQNVQQDLASVSEMGQEPPQPKRSAPPTGLDETLNEMSRERDTKAKSKDADFEAKRAEDKQQTNAKEYAYNKKLEAEEAGIETSDEDKAKSTFGKDYEKVQKSADDFDGVKTRFDDEAFQKSDKSQDKKARNKLKKLREAFREAATTGDVETLFSIYEDLQSDSNLSNFYNEEIQEDIDNWRKLSDPNLDSYNEGAAPYAAARTMQRMAHKFKLANEYQQTLSKMNETLRGSKNGVMRKIGKSEKLTSAVARALMRWQINPDTVFKMIDAFDKGNAGEGYKLAKELQKAHREKYRVLRESRAKFDKASDLKGYQDFAFGKQTVKDYSGREWDMRSALSVIKTIDTIRSTSGKKLGGTDGFGVMDSKGNVEFIDMKDVDAIKLYESLKSGLSDVAIKYGELATEAFNDVKEPLRAKYKQNNGVDIGMVGDEDARLGDKKGIEKAVYSPLSYVDKNGNVYQFDIAKQETYNNIPRFLRERSDAGGTYILIKPYTEVTGKYFEQVSNYLAYSTFNEKMRGLGKGSSYESGLGNTLADAFGKDMGNWYRSYVEDLGSYHNEDDVEGVNSLLRRGRQQLQQGALLFSVSVPMKQISSYWAASGILHPDSLIKNYRIKLLKPKNSSDAATMLASRAMGNLEQSAAEAANDAKKWLGKLKYSSKFIELAANAINQMDYNTVSNLLSATEYDVLKYQFDGDKSVIGTDEYKAAVEEKFQDVVDRSQPNFDKQMRAEYGRTDNEIVRMLSMFRTQQTQNLNLLATAIGEYQASKGTANQAKATETLKQTIAGQAASAFSLSMLTILADMLLHRQKKYEGEEEELDASKILTRLGINAIEASSGTLWFGDTIAKWAIDRISGGKTKEFYGVNMGVISTVSDILENFENFMQNPSRSNAKYCAGNIATLMGIPLNNAYAMLNSAIMYGKDVLGSNEGDYDDILRYLDAQTKAAKKAEEKAAKEAAKAEAKSGADMLADAAKQNSPQSELNSAEEQKTAEVSTYLKKPYNALVDAGMSSERSQEVLSQIDTDGNNSVKQSEMIAYYKAHPEDEQYVEAMWNSYGYKTSWETAKKKAG